MGVGEHKGQQNHNQCHIRRHKEKRFRNHHIPVGLEVQSIGRENQTTSHSLIHNQCHMNRSQCSWLGHNLCHIRRHSFRDQPDVREDQLEVHRRNLLCHIRRHKDWQNRIRSLG